MGSKMSVASAVTCAVPVIAGSMIPAARSSQRYLAVKLLPMMLSEGAVGVGRQHVVVVHHRERLRFQQRGEAAAVLDEEIFLDGVVAHASQVSGSAAPGHARRGAIPSRMILSTALRSTPISGRRGARVHSLPNPHSRTHSTAFCHSPACISSHRYWFCAGKTPVHMGCRRRAGEGRFINPS